MNEDLSNIGKSQAELEEELSSLRKERAELLNELRELDDIIGIAQSRLALAQTSRRDDAARLRSLEKLHKRAATAERRAQEQAREIVHRQCEEQGCSRLPRFYDGNHTWCKRHVPEHIRPRGKVT